jgi:hypothetical protein
VLLCGMTDATIATHLPCRRQCNRIVCKVVMPAPSGL